MTWETALGLETRLFPCLTDNYGFLVRDAASGLVAAVDTPDGAAVLAAAAAAGWSISLILNTHWHPDHTQGNAEVKALTGAEIVGPAEVRRAAPLDREIRGGDRVMLGDTVFEVLDTGGHTLGHVSYHAPGAGVAFVGDTLFPMGCGRLFEGSPAQMWESLSRLCGLPEATELWGAHEYTAANARFALAVDADPAIVARAQAVFEARARGEPTIPTTVALERATNPFLRAAQLRPDARDAVTAFAELRAAKDAFKG